jgi:hypothetical protein
MAFLVSEDFFVPMICSVMIPPDSATGRQTVWYSVVSLYMIKYVLFQMIGASDPESHENTTGAVMNSIFYRRSL